MQFLTKAIVVITICVLAAVSCTPNKGYIRKNNQINENKDEYFIGENKDSINNADMVKNDYKDDDKVDSYDFSYEDQKLEVNNNSKESKHDNTYKQEKFYQTGTASWYGREFHGKTTASGEQFNMYQYTAAHKKLPFGSIVTIKNFESGRKVKVKINDRGPYKGKRIIDMSYNAAKKLGLLNKGTSFVGIKVIKLGTDNYVLKNKKYKKGLEAVVGNDFGNESDNISNTEEYFHIQAGAFYSRFNADKLKSKIEGIVNNRVEVIKDGDFYKVKIKGIENKRKANNIKGLLSEEEIESFVIDNRE